MPTTIIPSWMDNPRHSKAKRASLRLKYMLSVAALRKYGRASMHDLAKDVPCNHSSIFNAISRGYFTAPMAESIERVFGPSELPASALIDPLSIPKNAGGQQ